MTAREKRPLLQHLSIEEGNRSSLNDAEPQKSSYSTLDCSSSNTASASSSASPSTIYDASNLSISERMRMDLEPNRRACFYSCFQLPKLRKHHRRIPHAHKQQNDTMEDSFLITTKNDSNIVGWLLVWFLMITMGWVCVFTISEGHIDWAELMNYEPIHPSITLQKRAGFRTLTYMVVGYLLPGIVSLLCLFVGLKLPSVKNAQMSKLVQLTNRGTNASTYWSFWDLGIILLFVIVLVGSFGIRFWHKYELSKDDWTSDDLWHYITKMTGMSLVNILMVVLFPICKTCFWWDLFGLGFERILKFHRLLGSMFVVFTFIHGIASVISLTMREQFLSCLWPFSGKCENTMVTYGWYSGILFLPVFVTSLPWVRRNMYQVFFYSHFMVIPALFMAHLHHVNLIYYLSPGLTAYILDKIIGYVASIRPVHLVDLSIPVPGYTRMVLQVKHNKFEPGQWIQVKVPAISTREWHPFSITSAPNHSTITLDIKAIGDWSIQLQQLAKSTQALSDGSICSNISDSSDFNEKRSTSMPTVYLDRYQGCDNTKRGGYLNHPAVLLVAGGIGITPMISVVRTLFDGGLPKIQHLVFVWVVKQDSVVDLYRKELARYQSLGGFQQCKVDILVYVTQSEPEPPAAAPLKEGECSPFVLEAINPDNHRKGTIFGTLFKTKSMLHSGPYSKTLLGHWHHALLMMAAGIGFMRGIVLGSSIAEVNEWRQEISVLLQLLFGILLAATLSGIVLSAASWYRYPQKTRKGPVLPPVLDEEEYCSLDMHKGSRPNINQIVSEMREQCTRSDLETVGVTICGPSQLTKAVMEAAYEASSPGIQFVVAEESFQW